MNNIEIKQLKSASEALKKLQAAGDRGNRQVISNLLYRVSGRDLDLLKELIQLVVNSKLKTGALQRTIEFVKFALEADREKKIKRKKVRNRAKNETATVIGEKIN